jgi:hypothetical protein
MPQLVHGHVRFTEEDFALTDFQEKAAETYASSSEVELIEKLDDERSYLHLMRDGEILELFNTEPNIKRSLISVLTIITALAQKKGFTLNQLLHN